jgi:hypothetical protein
MAPRRSLAERLRSLLAMSFSRIPCDHQACHAGHDLEFAFSSACRDRAWLLQVKRVRRRTENDLSGYQLGGLAWPITFTGTQSGSGDGAAMYYQLMR